MKIVERPGKDLLQGQGSDPQGSGSGLEVGPQGVLKDKDKNKHHWLGYAKPKITHVVAYTWPNIQT